MAHDIAEEPPGRAQHLEAPGDLGGEVQHGGGGEFRRGGQPVLDVAVPLALKLEVEGEHDGLDAGILRAGEKPGHEVVVLEGVDLKPEGLRGARRDILDRADREGGEGEGNSEGFCRLRRLDLPVRRLHAEKPHRGDGHGHGDLFADEGGGGGAVAHVDCDALAEIEPVEVGSVLAEGLFRPAAGLAIIVEHARDAAVVEALEVGDFRDDRHVRTRRDWS